MVLTRNARSASIHTLNSSIDLRRRLSENFETLLLLEHLAVLIMIKLISILKMVKLENFSDDCLGLSGTVWDHLRIPWNR